jgi:hypothetical protein
MSYETKNEAEHRQYVLEKIALQCHTCHTMPYMDSGDAVSRKSYGAKNEAEHIQYLLENCLTMPYMPYNAIHGFRGCRQPKEL